MNPVRQGMKAVLSAVLPRERWLVRGPYQATGIALTFDDGPHPDHTPRLLDQLARFQIRATFFVVGEAVARYPELTKRIVAAGHTLGGHSYKHSEPATTSTATLMAEVRQSLALLEDLTGQTLRLFRPPKGQLSITKTFALWRLHQTIVLWNHDPRDYRADPRQGIQPWVEKYCPEPGDIVLLHDTHPHCINAIEGIVRSVADRGLGDFATIDQWLPDQQHTAEHLRDARLVKLTAAEQPQFVQQGSSE